MLCPLAVFLAAILDNWLHVAAVLFTTVDNQRLERAEQQRERREL